MCVFFLIFILTVYICNKDNNINGIREFKSLQYMTHTVAVVEKYTCWGIICRI